MPLEKRSLLSISKVGPQSMYWNEKWKGQAQVAIFYTIDFDSADFWKLHNVNAARERKQCIVHVSDATLWSFSVFKNFALISAYWSSQDDLFAGPKPGFDFVCFGIVGSKEIICVSLTLCSMKVMLFPCLRSADRTDVGPYEHR